MDSIIKEDNMEMLEDGRGMDKMKYILENIMSMPEFKILMKKVEKDFGRDKVAAVEEMFNTLCDCCNYDEANEEESDDMESDEEDSGDNGKGLEIYIKQRKMMGDKGMMKGRGKPEEMMGE